MMSSGENDVCNHLKVIVRVRPENSSELDEKYSRVVHVVDEHMLVFDPKLEDVNFFHPTTHRDLNKRRNRDLKFIFDQVFDDSASQLDVFEQTRSILEGVFNGYNGTVFAYGATGAGKTHTMLGSPKQPGVMYLTMMELYNRMEQIKSERSCDVAVSYFEVYNEQIRDLLTNSRSLAMREDAQNGIVIQGLTLHKPKSAEQLLAMLDYGNTNRTQHPTDANSTSSRSHAVFQIYLRQQDRTAYISQSIKIAKMCLVDLAGSERNMSTKVARLREGANINRSLLALGNVINALADPKRRTQHIPYRNSKLTRILKDSLGGNCRTIMIVSISPSSRCYEDTYNTLNYANRAKAIKSSLKSNVLNLDCHVSKYAKICEEQKKEIMELKQKLKDYNNEKLVNPNTHGLTLTVGTDIQQAEIKRFKEVLKNIFSKRQQIRNENLDLQLKLKETELKSYYHKRDNQQIQLLCSEQIAQKALWKHEHRLAKINAHCLRIQEMKKASEKLFEENSSWLHQVERKTCLLSQDKKMPQVLQQDLHCSHLKMEVMDLKRQIGHMIRLLSFQESENKRTENLVNALLPAFRHQYYSLKKVGQASAATESQFMRIEQLVQQEKGVVWADETVELSEITSDVQLDFSSIISFSQLSYNQDIPCCTTNTPLRSLLKNRVALQRDSPFVQIKATSVESKENILSERNKEIATPYKSFRRRLEESLINCSDQPNQSTAKNYSHLAQLNDSLSKEVIALQWTPEICKSQTVQRPSSLSDSKPHSQMTNFHGEEEEEEDGNLSDTENSISRTSRNLTNVTYNLTAGCNRAVMDTTVTLNPAVNNPDCSKPVDVSHEHSWPHGSFLQRLGFQSLLNESAALSKPSYMGLTCAARRKRKSESFKAPRNDNSFAAKRIRQDMQPIAESVALRVPRLPEGSQYQRKEFPARRCVKKDLNAISTNKDQPKRVKSKLL
ncbi:kinesin-like protein KIF18A isoform X1 [Callorhinchus milii]|nr:kinesin-like protein KIF18A isoform X1 [Callorhinchus milii]XP_042197422.1 kinesin-like protein KIF18A isoform X1 [Callorhinchus milii]